MKLSFPYVPPASTSQLVYTDGELMEQAVEAFESGDYAGSLRMLVDALDYDFRERYGNEDGTKYTIPHGSIVVNIELTPEELHISADFLRLPEKGRVAMLRKIAEMNIANLMLARFVKNGDYLKMEYSCPATDTHPHKIYAVLFNMCAIGDKYDDELCTRFNATRCYEPKVEPYSAEQVDAVRDGLHTIGRLALDAAAEYCSQRRYVYAWTLLCGALYQFSFFANPQGQLVNEIAKAVEAMNDERPLEELVMRGKSFMEKLLAMPVEELAKDLYAVEMMVSMKSQATLQGVQEDFESLHEGVSEAMERRDYDQVVARIYYSFYQLLANENVPMMLEYLIITALRRSAELPLKEAAEILAKALDRIMDGDIEPEDDDDEKDESDSEEEDADDDELSAEVYANVVAAHQKMAEAMSGEKIVEMQHKMEEALKAGNVAEYMRLATELQMIMISAMGS